MTIGLLRCLPRIAPGRTTLVAIEGQPPDLAAVPPGCGFAPRCRMAEARCTVETPSVVAVGPEHLVACVRADATAAERATVAAPLAPPTGNGTARATDVVLEARGLTKHFPVVRGTLFSRAVGQVNAVDDVDFVLHRGETLGLVGESGCGKTTTARLVLRLETPTGGHVRFRGRDVHALGGPELRAYRRAVQPVFQDPYSSLNPRLPIRTIVGEPLRQTQPDLSSKDIEARIAAALERVGLRAGVAADYPHELSGGQRQRVALARALTTDPDVILLDEPVSALDVSIRAQVLNLFREIQARTHVSYLFIAHDLASVKYLSTRVAVMYLGQIVETARATSSTPTRSIPTRRRCSATPCRRIRTTALRLLARGFEVTGYDTRREQLDALATSGLRASKSAADAVVGVDAVLTILTTPSVVEEVWLGAGGLLDTAPRTAVLMQMSTVSPALNVRLGEEAARRGHRFLETPISGTSTAVTKGGGTLLVGGDASLVATCSRRRSCSAPRPAWTPERSWTRSASAPCATAPWTRSAPSWCATSSPRTSGSTCS